MSISRILGLALATTLTVATMTGITALITHDFGDVGQGLNWVRQAFSQSASQGQQLIGKDSALNGADNITFFKSVPIDGTKFEVTTGIAFASVDDVVAGNSKSRWCYIRHRHNNVHRQIELGRQDGKGKPEYYDPTRIPEHELKLLGLDAARLAELARSHCFLSGFDPRKANAKDAKTAPPPRVWQLPRIWRGQPDDNVARQVSIPKSVAPRMQSSKFKAQ